MAIPPPLRINRRNLNYPDIVAQTQLVPLDDFKVSRPYDRWMQIPSDVIPTMSLVSLKSDNGNPKWWDGPGDGSAYVTLKGGGAGGSKSVWKEQYEWGYTHAGFGQIGSNPAQYMIAPSHGDPPIIAAYEMSVMINQAWGPPAGRISVWFGIDVSSTGNEIVHIAMFEFYSDGTTVWPSPVQSKQVTFAPPIDMSTTVKDLTPSWNLVVQYSQDWANIETTGIIWLVQ